MQLTNDEMMTDDNDVDCRRIMKMMTIWMMLDNLYPSDAD